MSDSKGNALRHCNSLQSAPNQSPGLHPSALGISIVNFNSAHSVQQLLQSLSQTCAGLHVFIALKDNSAEKDAAQRKSLDGLAAALSRPDFQIAVHPDNSNVGYAAGNNSAVRLLRSKNLSLIWVLNPDCLVEGSGRALKQLFECENMIWSTETLQDDILSSGFMRLSLATGSTRPDYVRQAGVDRRGVTYPGGHSLFLTPDVWDRLDGFSEDYFLYMEEADLVHRSQKLHVQFGTAPGVVVKHEGGGTTSLPKSTKVSSKSMLTFEESTRSKLTFLRSYHAMHLPIFVAARLAYAFILALQGSPGNGLAVIKGLTSRRGRNFGEVS